MNARDLLRPALAIAVLAGSGHLVAQNWPEKQGCERYQPSTVPLIAHAGGGLAEEFYTNDREAMDLAVRNGFELIELDFGMKDGALRLWHPGHPVSSMSLRDLMVWLEEHPHIRIVTDVKTDNLEGLADIKRTAGDLQGRFIPQIYHPSRYEAVRAMGYEDVILTLYLLDEDYNWAEAANALDLFAVTMPYDRRAQAAKTNHFVYLHTVNEPMEGYGLYTDCLVPA